ncbi:MAG TPA: PIG-L deacetylase family protein [Acidimicrobiales bacterium]|nr:PIG-L deacetylase family protein [Acidimicrobiales bacterium]
MEAVTEDWERAAAIVAHPDDLEYGAASAVARWTSQGRQVSYVLATSGEAGIAGLAPDRCRPLREDEQKRSAAIVGVDDVVFLGHADGAVEYGLRLRRDLAGELRRIRPEVVVGMNFDLTWGEGGSVNHADHRAVGLAVLDACRDAANEWVFPESGEPWGGIRAVYISGTEAPTHYVDVTETIDTGIGSLRAHQAYIDGLGSDFDPDSFLRNITGYGGMAAGCEFAVLFQAFNAS